MLKKFVLYGLIIACFLGISFSEAEEYGNVYLDLKEDEETLKTDSDVVATLWKMAQNYVEDVKEYDDLLVGKTIDKKFNEDFKNKYENFNDTK